MKHKMFLQRCISLALGVVAIGLGMLAAVSTSAWYPSISPLEQGKAFQKYLPTVIEPTQLVGIKTNDQLFRFPDEVLTLTAFSAKQDAFKKADVWSLDSPSEVSLKQAPAIKIKAVSEGRPYIETQVADREHWFKGTTFYLKNNSDREVIHIQLDLIFPQTIASGHVIASQLRVGRWPGQPQTLHEPILLKPGDEIPFTLDDKKYASILKIIEKRQPVSTVTRVRVNIGFVIFSDGFGWGAGSYYRQDPNDPSRFENIGGSLPKK